MAGLDTASLLADVSPDRPCGDNLEYDLDFAALERAARAVPEQVMGTAVVPAKDPDWKDVRSRALDLLGRSKDLRIAVLLLRALLRTDGVLGFCDALEVLHGLVTARWEEVYPRLDPDEAFDPTARVNALAALCDPEALLRDLRETPLVISRVFGPVCWRDIAIVNGEMKPIDHEAPRFDPSALAAAFHDAEAERLQQVAAALVGADARAARLEQFLTDKVGSSHALDFGPLTSLLGAMAKHLNQRLIELGIGASPAAPPSNGGTEPPAAGGVGGASPWARRAEPGEIASRDDVVRMLDRICAYYARCEPASPVPLLLERAKRLVPLGFAEIVRDLAPDAMPTIEALRGPGNTNGSG
jgi:type VI secretion system protein ImpA